jgi:protein gp37
VDGLHVQPNVWLGATVVNQEEADRDIPKLLATPARVRFLSMEPLLGPVDLRGAPRWRDRPARGRADPNRRTVACTVPSASAPLETG